MMLLFFFAAIICNNLFAYLKFDTEIIEQSVDSDAVNFEFTFDFKNISKHSVKILEIKKSCSCTILDSDKKLYAPNAAGKIHGKLIIGDREGIFEKEIVVMTDDVLQPYIKLFLRINILKSCEINLNYYIGEKRQRSIKNDRAYNKRPKVENFVYTLRRNKIHN